MEQQMLNFGGVFQALSFTEWFKTPEVSAQWKQGAFRDQESRIKGYNDYVLSKYNEVVPFTQNDPSTLVGKTMIIWDNTNTAELRPTSILKTFPVAAVYCGQVYDKMGIEGGTHGNLLYNAIHLFTQPQIVGDLTWNGNWGVNNKNTNLNPTFGNGVNERLATYYVPEENPLIALRVVKPNGTYYTLNTKTMKVLENGKDIQGNLMIPNWLYKPGQYANLKMPKLADMPEPEVKKKRKQ